jgi:tetratricopeptide (TPR) repeat protein
LNYFDDSHTILIDLKDSSRIPRVLNNIGNIYHQLNDFDNALKKYNEAYDQSTNLAEKVLVFNNIADVYLKLRNYGRAFSILVKNAEFFQESQNEYGLSLVFTKLAKLYYEQGSQYFQLSKKYTQLALAMKKRNEFHRECIADYKLLSMIYLKEKSYSVAEDNLTQGLNLVRTLGFEQIEAFFYENLGKLYISEGRVEESIVYFDLARESYEKFAEKELEGQVLETIGDIYLRNLKNCSKTLEFYENALQIYKEESFRRKQADILVKIAELHIDLNETTSAIENLHKAHALYKTMYDETSAKMISERIKSMEY